MQVPVVHESQLPPHALLQQAPSTQKVDPHWLLLVQPVPLPYLQSMSCPARQPLPHGVHADGQNESEAALQARGVVVQAKVQFATVPVRVRVLLLSLTQASNWV